VPVTREENTAITTYELVARIAWLGPEATMLAG